jgi:hypothetical protein
MVKGIKNMMIASAIGLLLGSSVSASAASFTVANKSDKKEATEKVYNYAKNELLKKNKDIAMDAESGKTNTAKLFDKKAYKGVGAAGGYQDLLLGLKKQGYKFTAKDKKLVTDNLVITKKSTPAQIANAIIGLQAIGLNPKAYKTSGEKLNLVSTLYKDKAVLGKSATVNEQTQVLVALKSNKKFKAPKNAKFTVKKLSKKVAKQQVKVSNKKSKNYKNNGGWAYDGKAADVDVDTTAMTLTALKMSKNKSKVVKTAIKNGQNFLKVNVNKDGGFGLGGTSNANTNAEVIIAQSNSKKTFKNINVKKLNEKQESSTLKNTISFVKKDGSIKDAYDASLGAGQVLVSFSAYGNGKYASKTVYQFK